MPVLRLLSIGAEGERDYAGSAHDFHAATTMCWLSTAAIFRQPSILRHLIVTGWDMREEEMARMRVVVVPS
jgi:hypothetical protein